MSDEAKLITAYLEDELQEMAKDLEACEVLSKRIYPTSEGLKSDLEPH